MNLQSSAVTGVLKMVQPKLVSIALVVGMFAALLWQGYGLYQTVTTIENQPVVITPVKTKEKKRDLFGARQLAALNVFGRANPIARPKPKPEKKPELDVNSLKETKLNLVLKGAFKGVSKDESHALISTGKKKKSERYEINDKVQNGVSLYAVNADSVVLKRGASLEVLSFKRDLGDGSSVSVSRNDRSSSRRRSSSSRSSNHDMQNIPGGFEERAMHGRAISQARDMMESMGFESPEQMLESMGNDMPEEMMNALKGVTPEQVTGRTGMSDPQSIRDRLKRLREMRANR